ncbi:winged helix-turn-helix domain-containing protein [Arthrobacter sp. UM1]|uniref:winged helix-turn-helix domain-containing protein n=1 Tax=Arthrobacter sp. UM1 TaxID=2766776 RepID=UPI001CF6C1CD|nr:crosslink repair DNA glycosylase YcaQ family protein [Arthrobacter sp. UM1]MCB4207776.1 YcaQ family DNA glycosylase [Arthrobacter sp. UM1]
MSPTLPAASGTPVLSLDEARRTMLAAQRFSSRPPASESAARRRIRPVLEALGVLQIDSVTAVARLHYLPLFSRLGPYDTRALDRLHERAPRPFLEYWAHEASIVPRELYGPLRAVQSRAWASVSDAPEEQEELVPLILDVLARSRTPMTSRQIAAALDVEARRDRGHWGWNWAPLKHALGGLFEQGEVLAARRNAQFEREYAPAGRLLESVDVPPRPDAVRILAGRALRALGVASASSVADYFRIPVAETKTALERMAAEGEAERVRVEGLRQDWYRSPGAGLLRGSGPDALLSPFDSLVFDRRRLRDLWGMHYRLEFYVPPERRRFGYYVMPFLEGTEFTARLDVRLDRAAGTLRVEAAHAEPSSSPETEERALAASERLAAWLGAERVRWPDGGMQTAEPPAAWSRDT